MGFAEQFIQGFHSGRAARDADQRAAQDAEDRKLRLEHLDFERRRIKLEDKIAAQKTARGAAEQQAKALQGTPGTIPGLDLGQSLASPQQDAQLLTGGGFRPVSTVSKPASLPPVQVPGIPELGVPGYTAPVQSQQELLAAELAKTKALAGAEGEARRTASMIPVDNTLAGLLSQLGVRTSAGGEVSPTTVGLAQGLAEMRAREATTRRLEGQAGFTRANALRDDYRTETKPFGELDDAMQRMRASGRDATGQSDLGLLYGFMKMLDPGSVVRESEYATAARTGSMLERAGALANQVTSGARLTDSQRREFLSVAEQLYQSVQPRRQRIDERFRSIAKQSGVDPGIVVMAEPKQAAQGGQDVTIVNPRTGERRVLRGGAWVPLQ